MTKELECNSRKQALDSSQTYCIWSDRDSMCSFIEHRIDVQIAIYFAVLTVLATTLTNLILHELFRNIQAPTIQTTPSSLDLITRIHQKCIARFALKRTSVFRASTSVVPDTTTTETDLTPGEFVGNNQNAEIISTELREVI